MARKSFMGKLLTIAATATAIGGACYIFRDKIKASRLYEELGVDDKLESLKNLMKKHEDEEDFFDEDEYIFDNGEDDSNRNYVSLNTDTAVQDKISSDHETTTEASAKDELTENAASEDLPPAMEDAAESVSTVEEASGNDSATAESTIDEAVPTISLDTLTGVTTVSEHSFSDADPTNTDSSDTDSANGDSVTEESTASASKGDTPTGYDMEGLSDVSEDPDVLMEQDLLDEAPYEF